MEHPHCSLLQSCTLTIPHYQGLVLQTHWSFYFPFLELPPRALNLAFGVKQRHYRQLGATNHPQFFVHFLHNGVELGQVLGGYLRQATPGRLILEFSSSPFWSAQGPAWDVGSSAGFVHVVSASHTVGHADPVGLQTNRIVSSPHRSPWQKGLIHREKTQKHEIIAFSTHKPAVIFVGWHKNIIQELMQKLFWFDIFNSNPVPLPASANQDSRHSVSTVCVLEVKIVVQSTVFLSLLVLAVSVKRFRFALNDCPLASEGYWSSMNRHSKTGNMFNLPLFPLCLLEALGCCTLNHPFKLYWCCLDGRSTEWCFVACRKLSDASVALWVLLQSLVVAVIFLSLLLLQQNWKERKIALNFLLKRSETQPVGKQNKLSGAKRR